MLRLQLWFFTYLIIEYRELHALKNLKHKLWLEFTSFGNFQQVPSIPVRVLVDELFCMFRFSKTSFNALTIYNFDAT